jgi:hypothetical protein
MTLKIFHVLDSGRYVFSISKYAGKYDPLPIQAQAFQPNVVFISHLSTCSTRFASLILLDAIIRLRIQIMRLHIR